jgi:hypothetical protein
MQNRTTQKGRINPIPLARTAWLALFVTCQACQCAPTGEAQCLASQRAVDGFLIAGKPSTVTVGVVAVCPNSDGQRSRAADQVTVEVFDPDDQPVAFTVSEINRTPGDVIVPTSVEVSFTPDRVGGWRINTTFEPGIGRTSQVVQALEQRTDAGVRVVAVDLPGCTQYAVTELGTVLCGTVNPHSGPSGVATSRGQRLSGSVFAVDQNAVWSLSHASGTLERWVDDGSALKLSHSLNTELFGGFVAPHSGGLWMSGSHPMAPSSVSVVRVEPELDGGLSLQKRATAPIGVVRGMMVGDALFFSNEGSAVVTFLADGGSQNVTVPPGPFVGTDETTLWIESAVNGGLAAFRPRVGTPLQASVSLPLSGLPSFAMMVPFTPVVGSLGGGTPAVPRFDGTQITLEYFDPGPDYAGVSSANSKHAFARSIDGKLLKIFDR